VRRLGEGRCAMEQPQGSFPLTTSPPHTPSPPLTASHTISTTHRLTHHLHHSPSHTPPSTSCNADDCRQPPQFKVQPAQRVAHHLETRVGLASNCIRLSRSSSAFLIRAAFTAFAPPCVHHKVQLEGLPLLLPTHLHQPLTFLLGLHR
jgi:hypothetical protein